MSEPRRKNPEALRAALIEASIQLARDHGLAAVSLEEVARAAGVTKGGLFHHFPNKPALILAVFERLMADYDAEVAALMAADPEPRGRFTRAYLDLTFAPWTGPWGALWLSVANDPGLGRLWGDWLAGRLRRHAPHEDGLALETVRFAADGVWAGMGIGVAPAARDDLLRHLRAMTYPAPPAPTLA